MERVEYGVPRSTCSCDVCKRNCRFIPGMLIASDLERLIPTGVDPFKWAESNLLASPGAIAIKSGKIIRIPTLVPAVKEDGSCIHLNEAGLCQIHEVSPFGCAFFDCSKESAQQGLSERALYDVLNYTPDSLYRRLWRHLNREGKIQLSPNILRQRMGEFSGIL